MTITKKYLDNLIKRYNLDNYYLLHEDNFYALYQKNEEKILHVFSGSTNEIAAFLEGMAYEKLENKWQMEVTLNHIIQKFPLSKIESMLEQSNTESDFAIGKGEL